MTDLCSQCKLSSSEPGYLICRDCWYAQQKCIVCHRWHDPTLVPAGGCIVHRLCEICRQTTSIEEAQAFVVPPLFRIWANGCREDSTGCPKRTDIPSQPGLVKPWLFLGDYDDAMNFKRLHELGINSVLSLCPDRHPEGQMLCHALQNVEFVALEAQDDAFGNYDIITGAYPLARGFLLDWKKNGRKVLVNCWGGINRGPAIVAAWLISEEGSGLHDAISAVTRARGTVLTNHMFRLQLLRFSRQVRSASMHSSNGMP